VEKFHVEERHNYSQPNIIRVMKSRGRDRRACSTYGKYKCIQNFGWKHLEGKHHLGDL